MTTTTDLLIRSLLGRARNVAGGSTMLSHAHGHAMHDGATTSARVVYAPIHAVPMSVPDAFVTTQTYATAVVTNPWLGGFGFGDGTGICAPTVVDDSAKRIQPGRREGMT